MAKRKVKNRRAKGVRFEFEVQRWMKDRLINFRRVGMSGQLQGIKGDFIWVENGKRFRGEGKIDGKVPKVLYDWLEKDNCDFLVIRRSRKKRLWVLTDRILEELIK